MKLKSFFKKSLVLKVIYLPIVIMSMMGSTFAMHLNLPFEEIAQSADLIFIGTAAKQESRFNEQKTLILTEVIFEDLFIVHSTYKSEQSNSSFVILTYAGGCVDDLCLGISDAPSLKEGRRYLIFASDDGKAYINPIIGGPQGVFEVLTDNQTGEEFLLTAGKKVVLGASHKGLQKSKQPVSYIQDGYPVYDMSRDIRDEFFFTRPPKPANPADKASISFPGDVNEEQPSRALILSDFIDYTRDVALKAHIEKKILKKEGLGFFLKKKGQTVEKIPIDQLITPVENRKLEALNHENHQSEYNSLLTDEVNSTSEQWFFNASSLDRYLGGQLGYCGYHSLPLVMEMVPEDWWSYDTISSSMWIWNQFMDVYRIKKSDGTINANNGQNEFCGWLDDSTLFRIYGIHWDGNLGYAPFWWRRNQCGRILESDVIFNPAYNWTDDENSSIGNNDVILFRFIVMHELGHTWGLQIGKYDETYDYDSLTVVHSYYHHIVENSFGIHRTDAYLFRRAYSDQKGKKNTVDVGVESYYADNGLKNSWTNASSYYPGDSISLNNITVENNGNNTVSDLRVRIYLSRDRNITPQDYQIGSSWYWDSFAGENISVFDIDSTIPDNVPSGTYYIGVIVTVNGYNQDDFTYNNTTSFYDTITIKSKSSGGNGDGGDNGAAPKCFIATAAFNSGFHPYVNVLRDFRDKYLMHSQTGRNLVGLYCKYSPFLATLISKNKVLKIAVRSSLLPVVAFCYSLLQFD